MNDGFLLFGKRKSIRATVFDWLGIRSRAFSRMERRENNTRIFAIEEGYRKTLVAANLFEGIEAHHRRFVEALVSQLVEAIGDCKELLDLLVQSPDGLSCLEEDGFEISPVFTREKNREEAL